MSLKHSSVSLKTICFVLFATVTIFILDSSPLYANSSPTVSNDQLIYDDTNELSDETIDFIKQVNLRLSVSDQKAQVAVVLIDTLNGNNPKMYTKNLYNNWLAKEDHAYNNSAIILLSPNEGEIHVEVGNDLKEVQAYAESGRILDKNMRLLKNKDFDMAIKEIFTATVVGIIDENKLNSDFIFQGYSVKTQKYKKAFSYTVLRFLRKLLFHPITIIIVLFIFNMISPYRRRGWYHRRYHSSDGRGFGGGSFGGGGSSSGGGRSF